MVAALAHVDEQQVDAAAVLLTLLRGIYLRPSLLGVIVVVVEPVPKLTIHNPRQDG